MDTSLNLVTHQKKKERGGTGGMPLNLVMRKKKLYYITFSGVRFKYETKALHLYYNQSVLS
jgi:hypothetical protein